jgi:H+/Cl- antiporter ClcA
MGEATHFDLTVILGVLLGILLGLFAYVIYAVRDMSKMLRESQRMTRAVAGLVVQESDRIRALFGDSRRG